MQSNFTFFLAFRGLRVSQAGRQGSKELVGPARVPIHRNNGMLDPPTPSMRTPHYHLTTIGQVGS